MKKRLIAIVGASVLVLSLSTTAFAAPTVSRTNSSYGYGCRGGMGYGLMWDADGNFADQDEFESNLEKAIGDGSIRAEDKEYYVNMYDYCIENGGNFGGGCGGRDGFRGRNR